MTSDNHTFQCTVCPAEAVNQSLDLFIPEKLSARYRDEGYYVLMASGETKYKSSLLSSPGIRKDGTIEG